METNYKITLIVMSWLLFECCRSLKHLVYVSVWPHFDQ